MRHAKAIAILLLAGIGWFNYSVLHIDAAFAEEQTRYFNEMEQRARQTNKPKDLEDYIESIKGYYPSGTKQRTGSHLDTLVERARTDTIARLQAQAAQMKSAALKLPETGRLNKIKLGMSIDEVQAIFPESPASETKLDLGDDPSEDQKRTKGFYAMHLDAEAKILVFNYYKTLIKVRNQ